MARLPIPGGDDGDWGSILNSFLEVSLNADGTLKSSAVGATGPQGSTGSQGATGSVPGGTYVATSQVGAANGIASLNSSSQLTASQIPGSVVVDSSPSAVTSRNSQFALRDQISVKDYGATGNGTTDDTAAIQAAITAAATVQELYIPPGTYLCSNALSVPSYSRIRGAGWSSVLVFNYTTTATAQAYVLNSNANSTTGNVNIELRDFAVQGGWTSGIPAGAPAPGVNNWCSGVFMRRCNELHIEHLLVTNVPGISIAYQGVAGGRITNNTVRNSGRDGITGGPFLEHALTDILIQGNDIRNVGDDAIAVHAYPDTTNHNTTAAPKQVRVLGNRIHGADQYYGTTGTASIASGTAAVTAISPTMSSADVGKIMAINGAVSSAQIIAVGGDGTTCTLAAGTSATATVTNVAAAWANQAGRGIYLHGIVDSVCLGNEVDSTFSNAISVAADTTSGDGPSGVGGWRCINVTVKDNVVNGGGTVGDISQPRYGIRMTGADYCQMDGNSIFNSSAQGIYASDITYSSIDNNKVHNNGTVITDYGIYLDGVSSVTVNVIGITCRNNKIVGNNGGGIYAYYGSRTVIDGNEVYNNGAAGTGTDPNGSGMIIYNNSVLFLRNNIVTDLRSSGKTQTNGINFHDSGILIVSDNYSTNNVGGAGISYASTQTVLQQRDNITSSTASSNYDVEYSGAYFMSGTSTPLNNISAPIGSIYLRSDGGTSTTLYVKESGTSNTGWVAK